MRGHPNNKSAFVVVMRARFCGCRLILRDLVDEHIAEGLNGVDCALLIVHRERAKGQRARR